MLRKLLFAVLMAAAFAAHAVVYSLPWGPKPQFVDANGAPMVSGTLSTYLATTTTPQATYTDSTGGSSNPTTITLNSRGETPNEVWLAAGVSYKFILKDSAGSTVWTVDNVSGVNDVTAQLGSEWVASALTPTFVSTTSFTLTGDQRTTFHVGRRLKTTNSGGTIYSTVTAVSFASSTTVTVANDSGTLDSGLSAVSYGVVSANNPSVSPDTVHRKGTAVASAATLDIWSIAGDYVHVTGSTGPITSLGTAPYAGAERVVIFDSTPTITHNATTLQLPGGANIVAAAGDRMTVRADTTANMVVTSYFTAATGAYLNINSATEDTAPALGTDFVLTYDVSTTSHKKVLLGRIGAGVSGTEQASTSGTAIDFTGIPSWATQIVIQFVGVSTNGTSNLLVQIGDSGGIENSGYLGSVSTISTAVTTTNQTTGYGVTETVTAAAILHGTVTLTLEDPANFTWVATVSIGNSNSSTTHSGAGAKSTSAALDRVRITTVTGADTFDAGAINLLYR